MRCPRLLLPAAFPLLTLPLLAHAESLTVSSGDNLGALVQTNAADTFTIGGGTVLSLQQGNGQDTYTMSGGTLGSLNQSGDMDTFTMTGGTIGGDISTSSGLDKITLSGGTLKGEIRAGNDNDIFTWSGGRIGGPVRMGPGDDQGNIIGLDSKTLVTDLDGGPGSDSLVFEKSQIDGGAQYVNWEAIGLFDDSRLTLDDTLTLGDDGTGTGALIINDSSALLSRQGTITAKGNGQSASVLNAGMIDLSTGNDAQGRLTINGNYEGDNGLLRVNSVLAGDDAASDRLVVSRPAWRRAIHRQPGQPPAGSQRREPGRALAVLAACRQQAEAGAAQQGGANPVEQAARARLAEPTLHVGAQA